MSLGNQSITFNYQLEATSKSFNKVNYKLHPTGIYSGGAVSFSAGTANVSIAQFISYINLDEAKLGLRVETAAAVALTLSKTLPYIVGNISFSDVSTPQYMQFAGSANPDGDLVFGKAIFNEDTNVITGIDSSYKTIAPPLYYDLQNVTPPFMVTPNLTGKYKVNIGEAFRWINGVKVTIPANTTYTFTAPAAGTSRYDILYVTSQGSALQVSSGTASANPSFPAYLPNKGLPIAVVKVLYDSFILGDQITYIHPNWLKSNRLTANLHSYFDIGDETSLTFVRLSTDSSGALSLFKPDGTTLTSLVLSEVNLNAASIKPEVTTLLNPTTGVASGLTPLATKVLSHNPSNANDLAYMEVNNEVVEASTSGNRTKGSGFILETLGSYGGIAKHRHTANFLLTNLISQAEAQDLYLTLTDHLNGTHSKFIVNSIAIGGTTEVKQLLEVSSTTAKIAKNLLAFIAGGDIGANGTSFADIWGTTVHASTIKAADSTSAWLTKNAENIQISLPIIVTGGATFAGNITNPDNSISAKNLTASVGLSSGTGAFSGALTTVDILPATTAASSIGSADKKYKDVYGQNGQFELCYGYTGNDYADIYECYIKNPEYGKVYVRTKSGEVRPSSHYAERGIIGITSDQYAMLIGLKKEGIPIAVSGFLTLNYLPDYPVGTALTCGKNGLLTKAKFLTRVFQPSRVIATMVGPKQIRIKG